MALFKSKNPALSPEVFSNAKSMDGSSEFMTINGTVVKTMFLGLIVLASSLITWEIFQNSQDFSLIKPYVIGSSIAAFIVALVIISKKTTAPYLSPFYCVLEGLALGGLSAFMEEEFPGIVLQSIILTFGTLFSLLIIYRLGIIKVTENIKLIVASATMGIAVYYLFSLVAVFLGLELPYLHDDSTSGIILSLVVIAIVALNLVVDFDFIEKGAESRSAKYMEWYAAFGLMITVIWLYLEILRLLAKARRRK